MMTENGRNVKKRTRRSMKRVTKSQRRRQKRVTKNGKSSKKSRMKARMKQRIEKSPLLIKVKKNPRTPQQRQRRMSTKILTHLQVKTQVAWVTTKKSQ